ncbi:hypothetical protein PHJA_001781300 [Phtheirospermum japonicum]|uniref:AT3G52170-like helix-turn-helix domain-containing protein n=1 Tax=Phtheirospermum japonicum TaxID=374723 RepID=A0A830CDF3_9LAMI|nr:hypothetical protein PHJA_001781300 [Phtheirospermum japonicum]
MFGKMKLIRTVLQPANIGLSRQFQRSKLIKTCSRLTGSNIQWSGRSYAASASSEAHETKKARGRVSKDVRKSMVENFVNKSMRWLLLLVNSRCSQKDESVTDLYRETNAGKFPTASEAMKDVGGSYYVIREILQELIYNSKISPTASSEKSAIIKKDEISTTNTEEELIISPISKVTIEDSSSQSFESNQHPQPSISVESDESKEVGNQSRYPTDQPRSNPHLDPENDKTAHEEKQKFDEKIVHENEQKSYGSQSKAELQESTERELHRVTTEDADDRTITSVWQNLKSFANEMLDKWKRY